MNFRKLTKFEVIRSASLILIFTILLSFTLKAQDDQLDKLDFETEDAQPESTGYFAVGAGYTANFHLLNFDDLNNLSKNSFYMDDLKSPLFTSGFEIFTGTLVVKNLNVGFFNNSGQNEVSKDSTDIKRSLTNNITNSGFLVDYGFILFKSFAILPGIQVGWGSTTIEISQTHNTIDWVNIKDNPNDGNYYYKLEKSFLNLEPRISVQYAITNFLMFRANASYDLSINNPFGSSDWKFNTNASVTNVPSKINQSCMKFQLGIFVGLMNF